MTKAKNVQRDLFETVFRLRDDFKLDSELELIDQALCKDETLLEQVMSILRKRSPLSQSMGRKSTAVESVMRLLIVKHLYNWSFRFTVKRVNDSIGLRYFTRLYLEDAPDYSVLARYEQLIPAETLKQLNQLIVEIAKGRKVTRGRKLRVDTTCVETNIHYPTDSSLLADSVRVLAKVSKRVKQAGIASGKVVRDFCRSAKRQALMIIKFARGRSAAAEKSFKKSYRKLLQITTQAVKHAKTLQNSVLDEARHLGTDAVRVARKATEHLDQYLPRIEKVINQTEQRVFKEKQVANSEKIISLFEPHSYVVRKGKRRKPKEFGQVVKIQEADGGIITDFQSYPSQPCDSDLFIPSIETHWQQFDLLPHLACGDRGFYSHANEQMAYQMGVRRVCLPKRGKISIARKQHQQTRWFKAGQRFRAGSEGRISVLKRVFGFNRCLNKGQDGFERWLGWGVIASNLKVIAHAS